MALEQPKKVTGGAFGRYMAENRTALLKENPGKPCTEAIKLGSARFKALSPAEQSKYQVKYESAKQQYEKDLAAFKAAGGEMKAIQTKKRKEKDTKIKDPNKPKKPAGGAFGCYLTKNRAALAKECAGKAVTAVTKLAGERWKSMGDVEKKPFEAEYQKKKAAYEAAMKDYVPPAGAADEDEDEDGSEEGSKEDDAKVQSPAKKTKTSPAKKAKTAGADDVAAKKAKTAGADDVAAEAKSLGYARQFATLSDNPEVKASPSQILDALKTGGGKVVAVKKALLGA